MWCLSKWEHDAKYFCRNKIWRLVPFSRWQCNYKTRWISEKRAYFKDKDGNKYYVLFYQLTNGNDIKIADYKKDKDGNWKRIYINPEKCLEKNNKLK